MASHMLIRMTRAMRHDGDRRCSARRTLMQRVQHIVKSVQQRLVAIRVVHYVGQK